MELVDKTLICLDCQAEFVFTASEQKYHQEQGYQGEPRRCPNCRKRRKAMLGSSGARPGGHDGGPAARGPRERHPAVCTVCGKHTEVPFKPIEGRPVYCRDCFAQRRAR